MCVPVVIACLLSSVDESGRRSASAVKPCGDRPRVESRAGSGSRFVGHDETGRWDNLMSCHQQIDDCVAGAEGAVRRYFDDRSDGTPCYTGARFNSLGGWDDWRTPSDGFDCTDLVAVSMLAVDVPAAAALRLLEEDDERRQQIAGCLAQIPLDLSICDVEGRRLLNEEPSSVWQAYWLLRKFSKVGDTIASKLLARKRPYLVPVSDRVVRTLAVPGASWWKCVAGYFADDERVAQLRAIRDAAAPRELPLLRVLDIAVWMRGTSLEAP